LECEENAKVEEEASHEAETEDDAGGKQKEDEEDAEDPKVADGDGMSERERGPRGPAALDEEVVVKREEVLTEEDNVREEEVAGRITSAELREESHSSVTIVPWKVENFVEDFISSLVIT